VALATLPDQAPVEHVPRIELHARLGRGNLHHAPSRWLIHARGEPQRAVLLVQYSGVVMPLTMRNLLAVGVYSGSDAHRGGEIHRRAAHVAQLTERDEGLVDRDEARC